MDPNEMLAIVDKFIAEDTNPTEKELFQSSSHDDVLHDINDIQSFRESTKNMMNMKRIESFLTGMEHFEKVMIKLKLDPQHVVKLMACVWGPVRFLLEFTNRTDRELDSLLDVYEKIGEKLPLLYERMFLEYPQNVKKSWEDFEEKQTDEKTKTKKKVSAWISASKKMLLLHKKFQDARICSDTGRWLFKRYSEVRDWMHEDPPPNSALWLQGSRGFGKTILSSVLIDELEDLRTGKKRKVIPRDSKICYFYCEEEGTDHRTYLDILKGVLHQMVEVTEYLLPLCKENIDSSGILTDVATAEALIKAFFEYNTRQYIVIDGIDECEIIETRRAAKFFMEQVTYCDNIKQGRLRVLFMSQQIPELAKTDIMPEGDACVELKATDNAEDIRTYVKKRIPDFSKERETESGFNLSESDKQQIESIICRRSEDMFLYAHLAIEYLLSQLTKEKLIEKLTEEMEPKELSQIYEKLLGIVRSELFKLGKGDDSHWKMATQLIGWLVCAKRPLKWHEMQSILSYDPDQQKVDFDNKMLRQASHKYLGSLVHVLEGGHIRIVHSTARKCLIQNAHINEQAVYCDLAIRCLRYLTLISASKAYDENERKEKVKLGWFSFQDYACSQWHGHISTVISKCSGLLNGDAGCSEKFGSALQDFVDQNRADLAQEYHLDFRDQMPADLDGFSTLPFYQNLCILWNHIYTHQKKVFEVRNTVGIEGIEKAMLENRASLEANFAPNNIAYLKDTISDYYGPNLFKCKRLLCDYFHVGYDKEEDREAHNDRHDRPYQCSLRCNAAPIGFTSKKDLERHVRFYHPELSDGPAAFESLRPRTGAKEFPCSLCGKKFTRKINQVGHERSHFGERPFKCTHMGCDKAFTRLSDCQRHQKIHSRIVQ
ncbi:uncharacterized protein Triagg1_73 [Trichoderma aggressivum f. europaeum]|uniref:C2H2-type domain-containing protein n=1 Tax=Trichoderma aggressivum f. europaeum TaxID=173218 RepID=A0AAE1IKS6_9HYPO|nr:hypothetical protein Triagg1_73 [Trichoderma aggressivum f. europaeum]